VDQDQDLSGRIIGLVSLIIKISEIWHSLNII